MQPKNSNAAKVTAKATVKTKGRKRKQRPDEETEQNLELEPLDGEPLSEPDEEAEQEDDEEEEEEETGRRVCPALSRATEQVLVDFLREHPEFYDKSLIEFKYAKKKDRLLEAKAAELGLTAEAIKLWYRSQRTMLGKILKRKFGSNPKTLTGRQKWCYNTFSFLISHIVHRTVGFTLGHIHPATTAAPLPPPPPPPPPPPHHHHPPPHHHEEDEEPAIETATTSRPTKKPRKTPTRPDPNELLVEFLRRSKEKEEVLQRQAETVLAQSQNERRVFMEWMLRVTGGFPEHLWREFTMESFMLVARLQKRADVEQDGPQARLTPLTPVVAIQRVDLLHRPSSIPSQWPQKQEEEKEEEEAGWEVSHAAGHRA